MPNFPLANVILGPDDFTSEYSDLYYRSSGAHFDTLQKQLVFSGEVDFSTYFNALPLEKWQRYTNINTVYLDIELMGSACKLYFQEHNAEHMDAETTKISLTVTDSTQDYKRYRVELPESKATLISFMIRTDGQATIRSARYSTIVDQAAIREVHLALCTTTFRKEEFIVPNITAIRREILQCNEPVAQGFQAFVIDNGQTLDIEALSGEGVTVIPNTNVGGAGGFARGMIAALESNSTHALLMDDDVRVSPESLKRTFNLLSLLNSRYENAFLNGAMLSLEKPNLQYEDVAYVRKDGIYDKVKPNLLIDNIEDIIKNETIDVEVENAYGAWWYCCIPVSKIREHGLPLPVFVRCDDVEYGMRCEPTFMTMSGICVWHASFEGRFRASVDCYQYVRNFLIMTAVDGKSSERLFMLRLRRTFDIYLRSMNYESAELLLDGLEDYLKGPDFIAQADGEAIMKHNSQKNERLTPIEEHDQELLASLNMNSVILGIDENRSMLARSLETIPHDRHFLPDWLLSSKPAPVFYSHGAYPGRKTMRKRVLVAFDSTAQNAHIRQLDRTRYRMLRKRYRRLIKEYQQQKEVLRNEYQQAKEYLTSHEFWNKYLNDRLR